MSPGVAATTLREVLTMTGGFHGTIRDPIARYMSSPDPVAAILRSARRTPALLEVVPSHHLVVVMASQPDYADGGPGITPDSSIFLVDDAIAPAVRP